MVDIIIYEVIKEGKLKELVRVSGGDWGGISVDVVFEEVLVEIVGKDLMDMFCNYYIVDYLELFRNFELKKRLKKESDDVILYVFVSFVDICEDLDEFIVRFKF